MQATTDLVIVKLDIPKEKKGTLYLPNGMKSDRGTVIAVGPDCKSVRQNDKVVVRLFDCNSFREKEETFLVSTEKNILAIL